MENEVILTKEMFIDIMIAIRDMYNAGSDFYDKICNALGVYPENLVEVLFPDKIIDVMSDVMDDHEGWIGWYIYENDWGKHKLEVKVGDEKVPSKTLSDLWKLIMNERKNRVSE